MPSSSRRTGNAPISYGVLDAGDADRLPPDEVLGAIAAADYDATELGPLGYLGGGGEVRALLDRHGLELAAAYVAIPFSESGAAFDSLTATLDVLDDAGTRDALVLLADAGSDLRRRYPGLAASDRRLGLDEDGWRRFADGVSHAVELAQGRGFETAFHHHLGTYVEAPWEIERLLELSDVPLALDTGHLLLGGGDPMRGWSDWRTRIVHVHVKDVRRAVLDAVVAEGADMFEAWRRGVFCELDEGDVDLRAFFGAVTASDYAGWLVVEQDRVLEPGDDFAAAAAAQARNRRWLAETAGV